jgi:hypothetical protein
MTGWQNDKFKKWQVDKMTLIKWKIDRIAS